MSTLNKISFVLLLLGLSISANTSHIAWSVNYLDETGTECCLSRSPKISTFDKLAGVAPEVVIQKHIGSDMYKNKLRDGEAAYKANNYAQCLSCFDYVLSRRAMAPLAHDIETVRLLEKVGECYYHLGFYKKALCAYMQCLDLLIYSQDADAEYFQKIANRLNFLASQYPDTPSQTTEYDETYIQAHNAIVKGDYPSAVKLLQTTEKQLRSVPTDSSIGQVLSKAIKANEQKEYRTAAALAKLAILEHKKQLSGAPERITGYVTLGLELHNNGNYEIAATTLIKPLAWLDRSPEGRIVGCKVCALAAKGMEYHKNQQFNLEKDILDQLIRVLNFTKPNDNFDSNTVSVLSTYKKLLITSNLRYYAHQLSKSVVDLAQNAPEN
jgi:tetratricopeptide (TPR) repeat protein